MINEMRKLALQLREEKKRLREEKRSPAFRKLMEPIINKREGTSPLFSADEARRLYGNLGAAEKVEFEKTLHDKKVALIEQVRENRDVDDVLRDLYFIENSIGIDKSAS